MVAILSSKENILNTEKSNKADMAASTIEESIDEPNFSDPENFVDDIEDSELLEDVICLKPSEQEIVDSVVVVDGLPKVSESKVGKLKMVISKLFKQAGTVLREYHPEEPDPENEGGVRTKGYCFVEYESKFAAEICVVSLNGFKFDKSHTLIVTSFRNFEKLQNVEDLDKWEVPKCRPYKDRGNLRSWLLNPDCIDQFVLQYQNGEKVCVYKNNITDPEIVTEKPHWSDSFVRWSPYGTYLATVHKLGVALWGGEKFEQIMKFMHQGVQYLDFSPCENFIVTYAPPKSKYQDVPDAVKIWAIRTGELKRSFPAAGDTIKRWPHFKWSFDDTYFAALGNEYMLNFYESANFSLLDKKGFKIENVRDFQWSPSRHAIAYWVAEAKNNPGRTAVMAIPEKKDLCSYNVFNFADASIHWQKSGHNLCFKVQRYLKKKESPDGETKYSNISIQLEIIHMLMKDYPCSKVDLKDTVQALAWEPVGSKFCTIQGDMRSSIAVYGVKSNPAQVTLLKTLEHKGQANTIAWSPHGQYLVCAGLKTAAGGSLMFIDCSQPNDINYMNVQEHPGVTDLEWDPTGRYVVSSISVWSTGSSRAMDFGYNMYNFQGRPLARRPVDNCCAFFWRPRPPTLLTEEKAKEVKKNMKKYAAEFDEKDKRRLDKASLEVSEKRRQLMAEFKAWREGHAKVFASEKAQRVQLQQEIDLETEEFDEETVEYLINQEEIVVE